MTYRAPEFWDGLFGDASRSFDSECFFFPTYLTYKLTCRFFLLASFGSLLPLSLQTVSLDVLKEGLVTESLDPVVPFWGLSPWTQLQGPHSPGQVQHKAALGHCHHILVHMRSEGILSVKVFVN